MMTTPRNQANRTYSKSPLQYRRWHDNVQGKIRNHGVLQKQNRNLKPNASENYSYASNKRRLNRGMMKLPLPEISVIQPQSKISLPHLASLDKGFALFFHRRLHIEVPQRERVKEKDFRTLRPPYQHLEHESEPGAGIKIRFQRLLEQAKNGGRCFPRVRSSSDQTTSPDRITQTAEAWDDTEMKNYVEYKADKTTFLCHIEYILAPEVQPKSVDIICWERVAKIYVEEDSAAIIPLACDKIFWIYFRVEHMTTINNEDVNAYYNHNILLTVSLDGKKFGLSAKSEKAKVFYGLRHEPSKLFPSLWEHSGDTASNGIKITNRDHVLSTDFEANELSNKLRTVMREMTEEYDRGDEKPVMTGQPHPPWKMAQNKADGTTNSKTSISRNKDNFKSDISFLITGESILSGLKVIENYVKYKSKELPLLYSLVQVKNVLDPELAKYYNPLSITLKHLNFIPVSALHKEYIKKIRFRYTVCESYEAQSNDIRISEDMTLNYTRTILTDRIGAPELIEYIQTRGLTITLLGIREGGEDEMKNAKPKMFKDQRINCKSGLPRSARKARPSAQTGAVILGVAKIDISSLLLDPHRLTVKYNFNCGEFDDEPWPKTNSCSTVNPTEVNNANNNKNCDRLCHELISPRAVLTVSVRLNSSPGKYFEAIERPIRTRNRIFVVTNDVTATVNILSRIQAHKGLLAPTDYSKTAPPIDHQIAPTVVPCREASAANSESNIFVLTGFLIDCVDHFLIYVDGPSNGVLQEIWSLASSIQPSKGHVLYDSSLLFNQVSYEDLIRFGGFYVISLRQAPAALMNNKSAYKKGNMPSPAFKALIKLYHLSRCSSITKAVQYNLFPSYPSLLSLDLEFGVPQMFTQPQT